MSLKSDWVDALRSGNYQQGRDRLRRNDKFCCLGVLADINDPSKWQGDCYIVGEKRHIYTWTPNFDTEEIYSIEHFAGLNDAGFSFDEIADIIEYYFDENLMLHGSISHYYFAGYLEGLKKERNRNVSEATVD